ncbi:FG-GAP repeat domain-containing protein [Lentzea sp. NPDC051213]|uniref:FG-GAP repeat domain-containing protein n=1 Tax=Lentzea sp. NPDC051213 TaxID=3364126 RepID=UPI0037A23DEA
MKIRSAIAIAIACAGVLGAPGIATAAADDFNIMLTCADNGQNEQVTRSQVLARAQTWINEKVGYNQGRCYTNSLGEYRMDCSGHASMSWNARRSYTTSDIHLISHNISFAELKPGDALNRPGQHVAIFERWADAAKTSAVVLNHGGPGPAHRTTWNATETRSYQPIRYDHIVDDSPTQVGSSLTGDTKAEIAVVQANGEVMAWRNANGLSGERPWDASVVIAAGFTKEKLQFADVDGDGDKDTIAVQDNGTVQAWRNAKGWAPTADLYDGDKLIADGFSNDNIFFADLNGDRKAEIMAVQPNGDVLAWRNASGFAGERPWDASHKIATGFSKDNLSFADLDGDGRAEIMTVRDGNVQAWKNVGGFAEFPFADEKKIGVGFTKENLHFGDINGDARAEIITVQPDGQVWAWQNTRGFAENPFGDHKVIGDGFGNDNIFFL